jgi:NAD(P)-dependent dehydrogenase (short-subunit alcohol dehydrogenase family)
MRRKTISAIVEKHACIDVLINNAGIMLVAPLDAMAKADFEEAMQIHFLAPYHVTMAALPYLRRNSESRFVNISVQLVNSLLPKTAAGQGVVRQKGYQSQSAWAPSLLTILADRAAPLFNEGPQPRR